VVAWAGLLLAALLAVTIFFPSEGRLLRPLHDGLEALFGQATFVIPLGVALAGLLGLVRRARPDVALPRRRLLGIGLIALALLPAERYFGDSTGIVGNWLAGFLIDSFGAPLTAALILLSLGAGVVLTFNININRRKLPRLAAR